MPASDEDPFACPGAASRDAIVAGKTAGDAFGGGWIGYLGDQLARDLEGLPPAPPHAGGLPDHNLAHYDHALRRRAGTGRCILEAMPGTDPAQGTGRAAIVATVVTAPVGPQPCRCGSFSADASWPAYGAAATRVLGHIDDGDVFRMEHVPELGSRFRWRPLDLFCAGRDKLRPRFAAFPRVGGGAVASLPAELFRRRVGDAVLSSPAKGAAPWTRSPRRCTPR